MDWMDAEELAATIMGFPDNYDSDKIENALYEKFECSFEQFHKIAEALMPFTIPAKAAISGEAFHGFVKDGAFICKQLVTPNPNFYDLVEHLERQQDFSLRTFGPGRSTDRVIDHIKKELAEIKANPTEVTEWIDVVLLALDGAWRAGYEPQEICQALHAKLERNMNRVWPDWRRADPDKAIEHVAEALEIPAFLRKHKD